MPWIKSMFHVGFVLITSILKLTSDCSIARAFLGCPSYSSQELIRASCSSIIANAWDQGNNEQTSNSRCKFLHMLWNGLHLSNLLFLHRVGDYKDLRAELNCYAYAIPKRINLRSCENPWTYLVKDLADVKIAEVYHLVLTHQPRCSFKSREEIGWTRSSF